MCSSTQKNAKVLRIYSTTSEFQGLIQRSYCPGRNFQGKRYFYYISSKEFCRGGLVGYCQQQYLRLLFFSSFIHATVLLNQTVHTVSLQYYYWRMKKKSIIILIKKCLLCSLIKKKINGQFHSVSLEHRKLLWNTCVLLRCGATTSPLRTWARKEKSIWLSQCMQVAKCLLTFFVQVTVACNLEMSYRRTDTVPRWSWRNWEGVVWSCEHSIFPKIMW